MRTREGQPSSTLCDKALAPRSANLVRGRSRRKMTMWQDRNLIHEYQIDQPSNSRVLLCPVHFTHLKKRKGGKPRGQS